MSELNPSKFFSWVKAARLRTLPLALSSVMLGSFLAIKSGTYSTTVIGFSLLTTLLLQILSNFANDYGDAEKGTDNENRLGPVRTVQSGEISKPEMRRGILITGALSLISGLLLIYIGLKSSFIPALIFFVLGLASIAAAIKYVVGKNAYGYQGFGDAFVFIFFGLVGVLGSYYLNTHSLPLVIWLPAITIGLFSTGVLNLNNMRDTENDQLSQKITVAVRLGRRKSVVYHMSLITIGWLCAIIFSVLTDNGVSQYIYVITLPVFIVDLIKIAKIENPRMLDPYLKRLALSTLVFSMLFGIGLLMS